MWNNQKLIGIVWPMKTWYTFDEVTNVDISMKIYMDEKQNKYNILDNSSIYKDFYKCESVVIIDIFHISKIVLGVRITKMDR